MWVSDSLWSANAVMKGTGAPCSKKKKKIRFISGILLIHEHPSEDFRKVETSKVESCIFNQLFFFPKTFKYEVVIISSCWCKNYSRGFYFLFCLAVFFQQFYKIIWNHLDKNLGLFQFLLQYFPVLRFIVVVIQKKKIGTYLEGVQFWPPLYLETWRYWSHKESCRYWRTLLLNRGWKIWDYWGSTCEGSGRFLSKYINAFRRGSRENTDETKGNKHKRKFRRLHLNIKRKSLTARLVNKLLRKTIESPSLKMLEYQLDTVLRNLIQFSLLWEGV